jgi:hypothetical protein
VINAERNLLAGMSLIPEFQMLIRVIFFTDISIVTGAKLKRAAQPACHLQQSPFHHPMQAITETFGRYPSMKSRAPARKNTLPR